MPPQGLLLMAAYLPQTWQVRFIDENISPAGDQDYQWADAVFISGMHVQRRFIDAINHRAHQFNKLTVLGGPSVSGCPEYYPQVDILHLGEIGDATDELIHRLDLDIRRPGRQLILRTADRLDMTQFPSPAYHLLNLKRYFIGSIQFSSGCPFMCEFCDIPALYGRSPRVKTTQQIQAELDALLAGGLQTAVYFVDDNFIANPAAARELLPALIDWQRRHGYPFDLCCEATLNLAQFPDLLDMMRQARFTTLFCGIETPETEALSFMQKKQNLRQPILRAVRTFNEHGIEIVSGIILGLDTDTPDTPDRIVDFIAASHIPMLTINLLYALPKTRLYERLEQEGRLIDDPTRATNVDFKLPYPQVIRMWRSCIQRAYDPATLYERFAWQCQHTFPNRLPVQRKVTASTMLYGLRAIKRVLWHVGYKADYRNLFWQHGRRLLKHGRIDDLMHVGIVSHHLIQFTRASLAGQGEACFYADPSRTDQTAAMAD